MKILILRTIVIYCCVLFAVRLMGKRQLGQLQPSELVTTILISSLASTSIETPNAPITASLVPLFLIVAIEIFSSILSYKNLHFANFISGRPNAIIRNGKIDQKKLFDIGLNAGELLEALRGKDIFDINEVSYAVIEADGSLSVSKKPAMQSLTCGDLGIQQKAKYSKVALVIDGIVLEDNLAWCGKSKIWINEKITAQGITLNQVLVLIGDDTENYFLVKRQNFKRKKK